MKYEQVSMVVAYDKHRGIGYKGRLPWGHTLKQDLAMYKQLTTGTSVIMGSRTFESLGKALPSRENIVISRHTQSCEGALVVESITKALQLASKQPFIIGGGQIYELGLPYTDRVYATEVDGVFTADAHFPELDPQQWRETSRVSKNALETKEPYSYDFVVYDRRYHSGDNPR